MSLILNFECIKFLCARLEVKQRGVFMDFAQQKIMVMKLLIVYIILCMKIIRVDATC